MQSILVNQDLASLRIDKLLCKKFDISFSLAQKLVREKKIKVNDKKADTNYKAQIGDTILIFVNLPPRIENSISKPAISKQKQQDYRLFHIALHSEFPLKVDGRLRSDDSCAAFQKRAGTNAVGSGTFNYKVDSIPRKDDFF